MRSSTWRCAAALPSARSFNVASNLGFSLIRRRTTIQTSSIPTRCTPQIRHFTYTRVRREEQLEAITSFSQLSEKQLVHDGIVKSITAGMGLSNMTEVQSATVRSALQGTDVIAQAKTGTGKTLAFLIPILQRMIQDDPNLARPSYRAPRTTADDIRGIIISPTRELAEQIAEEARKVVKGTSIVVQTAVGGTQKRQMLQQMQRQGCHLLVGTPGRLSDIFQDQYSGVAAPNLKAFVLDEADRLLDQGFWPDIQQFMRLIPDRAKVDRQTLMFSATIPKEVVNIVRQTLKQGFQFVRVMGSDQDAPTTERVKQNLVILRGFENQLPALVELTKRELVAHTADPATHRPFKAIVYFRSTAEVSLARSIFSNLSHGGPVERDAFGIAVSRGKHPLHPLRIFHIHSKLTQAQRTIAADSFRAAENAILLSSDVTARGLDFPNVTHVIQIGSPQDRESYIHRIGRTARAGKEGEGWILVTENEVDEVDRMLRKIPIDEDTSLVSAVADMSDPSADDAQSPTAMVRAAAKSVSRFEKNTVYNIFIAAKGAGNKRRHVAACNAMAANAWGMTEPPAFSRSRAQKLGLGNVPGLNLVEEDQLDKQDRDDFDGGRSGGGRFGGGGGRFGGDRFGGRDGGRDNGRFGGRDRNANRGGGSRYGGSRGGRSGGNDSFGESRFGSGNSQRTPRFN